ncbi:hypothetical protein NDU88_001578 [Pleurodeles waltl]|uniref:Uncharacterized protein n=1 Tax=Pleurodeles waltl TaxID=8319 RepID=A0AAV7NDT0_PLEWA|nr:hypothetical protein NDU88_001578 [Pleurodeles waltl]
MGTLITGNAPLPIATSVLVPTAAQLPVPFALGDQMGRCPGEQLPPGYYSGITGSSVCRAGHDHSMMLCPATTRIVATGGPVCTAPGALRLVCCSSPAYLIGDMWRGGRPNSLPLAPVAASSSPAQATGLRAVPQLRPQCPFRPAGSLRQPPGPRLWVPASTQVRPSGMSNVRPSRAFLSALLALGQRQPVVCFFGVSDQTRFVCLLPTTPWTCQVKILGPDGVHNAGYLSGWSRAISSSVCHVSQPSLAAFPAS